MSAVDDGGPQPTAHESGGIGRRDYLERIGVAAGTLVTIGAGGHKVAPQLSPIGRAKAIPPAVIGFGAAVAVHWTVSTAFDYLDGDEPADGLTPEALEHQLHEIARARESTNASTFTDNMNILDGLEHTAYEDGKMAAIEALNDEQSLSDTQAAAQDAVDEYISTVLSNLLKSWNESAHELETLVGAVNDHPDIILEDVTNLDGDSNGNLMHSDSGTINAAQFEQMEFIYGDEQSEYEDLSGSGYVLPNGETFTDDDGNELVTIVTHTDDTSNYRWNPAYRSDRTESGGDSDWNVEIHTFKWWFNEEDLDSVNYLYYDEWNPIINKIEDVHSTVSSGLTDWTATVHDQVQAGEIDTADLLTSRDLASTSAEEDGVNQGIADLMALNMPVDLERTATIQLAEDNITIEGVFAFTSEPAEPIRAGNVIDPTVEDYDVYFTYYPDSGSGYWADYESTAFDFEVVFTAEPAQDIDYTIKTDAGDVTVTATDFEEGQNDAGDAEWVADVSEDLDPVIEDWTSYEDGIDGGQVTFTDMPDSYAEFTIETNQGDSGTFDVYDFTDQGDGTHTLETDFGNAEIESVEMALDEAAIESVEYRTSAGEWEPQTVFVDQEFTVLSIKDADGQDAGELTFTSRDPQDDTNYITQEEWEESRKQYEELIDQYEESLQDDDGGSGDDGDDDEDGWNFGFPSFGGGVSGGSFAGLAIIAAVVLAVVGFVTDLLPWTN